MNQREPEYLSTPDAARYLEVSRQYLWELAKAGRLGRKFSNGYYFTRDELDEYRKQTKSNRHKGQHT